VNQDKHEEEERNKHANGDDRWKEERRVDDHQVDNFQKDNHREQRNIRANRRGD
jgi:hypothetical protein